MKVYSISSVSLVKHKNFLFEALEHQSMPDCVCSLREQLASKSWFFVSGPPEAEAADSVTHDRMILSIPILSKWYELTNQFRKTGKEGAAFLLICWITHRLFHRTRTQPLSRWSFRLNFPHQRQAYSFTGRFLIVCRVPLAIFIKSL
jgi:hypothetical protein